MSFIKRTKNVAAACGDFVFEVSGEILFAASRLRSRIYNAIVENDKELLEDFYSVPPSEFEPWLNALPRTDKSTVNGERLFSEAILDLAKSPIGNYERTNPTFWIRRGVEMYGESDPSLDRPISEFQPPTAFMTGTDMAVEAVEVSESDIVDSPMEDEHSNDMGVTWPGEVVRVTSSGSVFRSPLTELGEVMRVSEYQPCCGGGCHED